MKLRDENGKELKPPTEVSEKENITVSFTDNIYAIVEIDIGAYNIIAYGLSDKQYAAIEEYADKASQSVLEAENEWKSWQETLESLRGNTFY